MMFIATFLMVSLFQFTPVITKADTGSYTTNLATAAWRDQSGSYDNRADYSKAPFILEEASLSVLFSAGYHDPSAGPRLGSHNAASYAYHDLDHESLIAFRDLTSHRNAAVMALDTPLLNVAVTSLTFSWSSSSGGTQDIYYIFSQDGGTNWHLAATGNTASKTTIQFEQTIKGNHLKVGVFLTYSVVSYRYLSNPNFSFDYRDLTDLEQAEALKELVAAYSPCPSDDQELLWADENVAMNLLEQYESLTPEAREIFDDGMIDETTRHRDRLWFILNYHRVEILTSNQILTNANNYDRYIFILIAIIGVMGYAATKRSE